MAHLNDPYDTDPRRRIGVNDRVKVTRGVNQGRCASVLEVFDNGLLRVTIPFSERPWWMVSRDYVTRSDVISELGSLSL